MPRSVKVGTVDLGAARRIFASKHECSPDAHRAGYELIDEINRLGRALDQACMNLATIRPLDVMQPHEDLSLGECQDRWRALVLEQVENS
jgi:hypothetical protein